jgi:hypothetical protein
MMLENKVIDEILIEDRKESSSEEDLKADQIQDAQINKNILEVSFCIFVLDDFSL